MATAPSTYLQHLPEVFRVAPRPGERPFLADYLSIFEALLSGRSDASISSTERVAGLEEILRGLAQSLDPAFSPVTISGKQLDSPLLSYLASWVALTLDQNWDLGKRRRWLERIVPLYRRRGTRAALDEYLEMFVGNNARIEELAGGFVVASTSTVAVDTFIAGAPAYYFRVRLQYAFGLQPFDLATWLSIRSGARAIVDLEKPAHTYYSLDTRTPGIIVAVKGHATVGHETLIWQNSRPF